MKENELLIKFEKEKIAILIEEFDEGLDFSLVIIDLSKAILNEKIIKEVDESLLPIEERNILKNELKETIKDSEIKKYYGWRTKHLAASAITKKEDCIAKNNL